MVELINPSVWRNASWNTAFGVSAVSMTSAEYQTLPSRIVRGSARQPAIAVSQATGGWSLVSRAKGS